MAVIPGKKISEETPKVILEEDDLFVIEMTSDNTNKHVSALSLLASNVIGEEERVIVSGAITLYNISSINIVTVDTESSGPTDNLDTITVGANEKQIVILQSKDSARTVTVRDHVISGGNICVEGASSFPLNHVRDKWTGVSQDSEFHELSRSNNM